MFGMMFVVLTLMYFSYSMGSIDGYGIAEKNSEQSNYIAEKDPVDKMIDDYWRENPDKDPCNKAFARAYGLC